MQLRLAHVVFSSCCLFVSTARAEAPPTPPAEQAPSARDRIAGTYVFAGGEKETAAKDAAIDKATEDMFFAIKGIARSKLRESTPVRQPIGIAFANGSITVSTAGTPSATSPENGSYVAYPGTDGTPSKLSQKLTADGKLVQIFASDRGSRTNTFALSADGKTLTMWVSVDSSKLPKPVRYTLTYRRS